jgi:hypothetical protein
MDSDSNLSTSVLVTEFETVKTLVRFNYSATTSKDSDIKALLSECHCFYVDMMSYRLCILKWIGVHPFLPKLSKFHIYAGTNFLFSVLV